MTIDALQADMTLIMACVSTRPTVQRETIVRVTGDVKAELPTTHGSCVPPPVDAWLPRAISTTDLQGTGRGQSQRARRDDRKLSAQSVVARWNDQENLVADDCSRRFKKSLVQGVGESCVRRPVKRVV